MNKLKDILWVLLNPSYWIMSCPYSKEWDKVLRESMSNNKFIILDHYTAKLGKREIWICNHPDASFRLWVNCNAVNVRPSRITIRDAYNKLLKDAINE